MDYKLSMIVFSYPGIGKTTLLATAADDDRTSPSVLIDLESNLWPIKSKVVLVSLEDLLNNNVVPSEETKGKIYTVSIHEWTEFERIVDFFERKEYPWKSVCIDSLSEINWLNVRMVCRTCGKRRPGENEPPELEHYNHSHVQMLSLIRRLRDIKPHVFLSCHVREDTDESTKVTTLKTGLVKGLAKDVGYLIHLLGYYYANQNSKRIITFEPTHRIIAKHSTEGGGLVEPIENPTITKILDEVERR